VGIKARTSFALKDQLFNPSAVSELGERLADAMSAFPRRAFEERVLSGFPSRELKERIDWIVLCLEEFLPRDLETAIGILERALPPPLDPSLSDNDFGKFIWVVPGEYVAKHGCAEEHLSLSLTFLRESTKRFSAEWAIRPFILRFPDQTLEFLRKCAEDENYHVRRLASEGSRALLPWGVRASFSPEITLELLEVLHRDPTRYVTRSVANSMNDLSKSEPTLVLEALTRWQESGAQAPEELLWMTRHALRTLRKGGHPQALGLLGYTAKPLVKIAKIEAPHRVNIGEDFSWSAHLQSEARQTVHIALEIGFLRQNGTHAGKRFVVKDGELKKGATLSLQKRISLRPMTTRTLYPGEHRALLFINGKEHDRRTFQLIS
jgi:3-methyladenine DNA glycosylase AlkC